MAKYVVRYGSMRSLGIHSVRGNEKLERGAAVISRTERGLEAGEVLAVATDESLEHLSHASHGQILRRMTSEDVNEWIHIQAQTRHEFDICQRWVHELGLAMQLVDLERLLAGSG
jgi:cell fate regulator YaaT (PSP1 superfamily)